MRIGERSWSAVRTFVPALGRLIASWWPHGSPRRLHRRPHPRSETLTRGGVVAPVPQNGLVNDLEPFRGDEARDGLLTARLRFEGDKDGRILTKLASDSH